MKVKLQTSAPKLRGGEDIFKLIELIILCTDMKQKSTGYYETEERSAVLKVLMSMMRLKIEFFLPSKLSLSPTHKS